MDELIEQLKQIAKKKKWNILFNTSTRIVSNGDIYYQLYWLNIVENDIAGHYKLEEIEKMIEIWKK